MGFSGIVSWCLLLDLILVVACICGILFVCFAVLRLNSAGNGRISDDWCAGLETGFVGVVVRVLVGFWLVSEW